MAFNKSDLEAFQQFLHEKRGNESNFQQLKDRLEEEVSSLGNEDQSNAKELLNELQEAHDKLMDPYLSMKENNSSAWPEFEKFVTHMERAVSKALKSVD